MLNYVKNTLLATSSIYSFSLRILSSLACQVSKLYPSLNICYWILLPLNFLACLVPQLHSSLCLGHQIVEIKFFSFDTLYWFKHSYSFQFLYLFSLLFTIQIVYLVCPLVFSAALLSEFSLFSHAKPTIQALRQSKKLCFR